MHLPPERLREISSRFATQRIVVIGDVMLDHVITGEAARISPEAPIPVLRFRDERYAAGGAANVAQNLAALGCAVDLFGVVGADADADHLRRSFHPRINAAGLVIEPNRPTTVKSRVVAQRQQIVRVDRETARPLEATTAGALAEACRSALRGAAAVIVADYAKGVIDQPLLDAVMAAARSERVPVCVDPKPSRRLNLRGAALLTPNRKESFELAGLNDDGASIEAPTTDPALLKAVVRIQELYQPEALLITLSEAGLLLIEPGQPARHIPTFARQVYDVTGAGDTVIACFVLARAAGATLVEAAIIANHGAGAVVAKTGTATVSVDELVAAASADRRAG